jgi:hypothetical protein
MKAMFEKNPFSIQSPDEFKAYALNLFAFQYLQNAVYGQFCDHLGKTPTVVKELSEIPFMPISFFKSHAMLLRGEQTDFYFSSSGTTDKETSKHFVPYLAEYEMSYTTAFDNFYGKPSDYCILALLPAYLEREGSSLIYMVADLISKSEHPNSGFYLNNFLALKETLESLEALGTKTLLMGVSFALLDFVEQYPMQLKHTIVMETGGMKGRRKEMVREALHTQLTEGFGVAQIHSEYGMTELLSQGYSKGLGIFECPPWMKIYIRDTEDPLNLIGDHMTGGVNVIDLANTYSCAFIATQDLGKTHGNGRFSILGRFDHAAIRGCNLLVP